MENTTLCPSVLWPATSLPAICNSSIRHRASFKILVLKRTRVKCHPGSRAQPYLFTCNCVTCLKYIIFGVRTQRIKYGTVSALRLDWIVADVTFRLTGSECGSMKAEYSGEQGSRCGSWQKGSECPDRTVLYFHRLSSYCLHNQLLTFFQKSQQLCCRGVNSSPHFAILQLAEILWLLPLILLVTLINCMAV